MSRKWFVSAALAAWVCLPALALGVGEEGARRGGVGPTAEERAATPRPETEELETPSPSSETGLRLYGFADMSYGRVVADGIGSDDYEVTSTINGVPRHWAFAVGNLNLYLDGQLGARARSLAEIRFTYLPGGTQSTLVPDHAQVLSTTQWGGIVIERAWVEYTFSDLFTVRAGQFFTPYGIWNVDHGSPVTIAVQKPEITSAQLFPERQVGLEGYGTGYLGSARLGYHLTVSNGRIGDGPAFANYSGTPGLGARLFVEGDWLGELKLGVSGFTGRHTELVTSTPTTFPVPPDAVTLEFDEHDAAADVRWEWKGFVVVTELIYQRLRYTDRGRPTRYVIGPTGPVATPDADHWKAGSYALAGYRLPYAITPFVMWDLLYQSTGFSNGGLLFPSGLRAVTAGLNYRPLPALVLKAEYTHIWAPHASSSTMDLVRGQAAWAF